MGEQSVGCGVPGREISKKLGEKAISRPEIDISRKVWGGLFNEAFGTKLKPAFDPYTTGNHFLLAAYMLPYVSYTGYVALGMHAEGKCARDVRVSQTYKFFVQIT